MPILSVYFGFSSVTILIVENEQSYKITNFPYIYTENVFGQFLTPENFYTEVFTKICKEQGIKFQDCTLAFVYKNHLRLRMNQKLSENLQDVINKITTFNTVFINGKEFLDSEDYEVVSRFSNTLIYPFISFRQAGDILYIDNKIKLNPNKHMRNNLTHVPTLYTGERFGETHLHKPLSYLLTLDMTRDSGIYEVCIDTQNAASVLQLLAVLDPKYDSLAGNYNFERVGTLFNARGNVECLFETAGGGKQIIDITDNSLFFIPLEASARARVVLKSFNLGTFEKVINGGTLGFIIDTRDKSSKNLEVSSGRKEQEKFLKLIEEALISL